MEKTRKFFAAMIRVGVSIEAVVFAALCVSVMRGYNPVAVRNGIAL